MEEIITIGCVARCKQGKLGIITKITTKRVCVDCGGFTIYEGIGFDGKPWQSQRPEFVASNIDSHISRQQMDGQNDMGIGNFALG